MRVPLPLRLSMIRQFLSNQAGGGQVLMLAAALAMLAANSRLSEGYFQLLQQQIGPMNLLHWINDALMAVFFLLVGCEIKRELVDGQMASWPRRILPGVAAAAGMAVPALVFIAFNAGTPANLGGWAIPTATDIAFALGVMALLGDRVPGSLKMLLTAIAVIDDLGAIAVIAAVYTDSIVLPALLAAVAIIAALMLLSWRNVQALWPYLTLGVALWLTVHASGIHATLAGVITALALPIRTTPGAPEDANGPLLRVEHAIAPIVSFAIVPVFGFANAGVDLRGLSMNAVVDPLVLGVAAGLMIGKQLGIFGAVWGLARAGIVDMPADATTRQVWGMSILCGIGFTMSLFIAALAFGEGSAQDSAAKLGILGGSLLAALAGLAVLGGSRRESQATAP